MTQQKGSQMQFDDWKRVATPWRVVEWRRRVMNERVTQQCPPSSTPCWSCSLITVMRTLDTSRSA